MFQITLILFAIIIGTNGKTYNWKDCDETSEIPFKFEVQFSIKTPSKTVKEIETVNRTVKFTIEVTKKIVYSKLLITTTNNGVVTLDRTLAKLNISNKEFISDHFFNSSEHGIVSSVNKIRINSKEGRRYIDYSTNSSDPSWDKIVERRYDNYDNTEHTVLNFKPNGTEIHRTIETGNSDGSITVQHSKETKEGETFVTFEHCVAEINRNNWTSFDQSVSTICGGETKAVVRTIAVSNSQNNSMAIDHFVQEKDVNGGQINERISGIVADNGTVLSSESLESKTNVKRDFAASKGIKNLARVHLKFITLQNIKKELSNIVQKLRKGWSIFSDL
ncbi:Protein of unknown function [Cotesia congregata]|uniref:Uncharacterized protein n=1 Tax=Cotesia congregata TaxID=51543 RepID=A0A8J2HNW7_COTCN|nr:Protein of unknown function [Cotesia congregata]CAG5106159.1 Protein of unknown function [Cotesia congregata]